MDDIPYKTRVPAKSAWLPAERTDVRTTEFMNEAATSERWSGFIETMKICALTRASFCEDESERGGNSTSCRETRRIPWN